MAGMKAQKNLAYNEKVRKDELKKQIETLKANYGENQEQIFKLERTLGLIIDNEIREKLLEIKSLSVCMQKKPQRIFLTSQKKLQTQPPSTV